MLVKNADRKNVSCEIMALIYRVLNLSLLGLRMPHLSSVTTLYWSRTIILAEYGMIAAKDVAELKRLLYNAKF